MIWPPPVLARLWRPIAATLAAIVLLAGAYLSGRSRATRDAELNDLEDYHDTRNRIDNAPDFDRNADAARDWLRNRPGQR